jgi:WD40 repeat protein
LIFRQLKQIYARQIQRLRSSYPGAQFAATAFTPNDELLPRGQQIDGVWEILLWDTAKRKSVKTLLVSAFAGLVCRWDLTGTGEKLAPSGHTLGVPGLAFNSNGTMLASASKDRTVKIWDPVTGKLASQLSGFRGVVQTVAFSPDDSLLAVGGMTGDVEIWSPHLTERLAVVDQNLGPEIWATLFSPDGKYFAVGGEEGVRIWQLGLETHQRDRDLPGRAPAPPRISLVGNCQPTATSTKSLCFSPNSKLLAWVSVQPTNPIVWDLETNTQLCTLPSEAEEPTLAIAFYPDSEVLTFVNTNRVIEAWNVRTRQRVSQFAGKTHPWVPTGHLNITALSSDGRLFAWASGQTTTVWGTSEKSLLLKLPAEHGAIWYLAWSPDAQRLAAGTSAGGPMIWNIPKIRAHLANLGLDW